MSYFLMEQGILQEAEVSYKDADKAIFTLAIQKDQFMEFKKIANNIS